MTQPPSVYLLSSIGAIGIPYWIERMDSASPHEGQLSGFSFNSYIYKVWNRGAVLFALGGFYETRSRSYIFMEACIRCH